MLLSPRHRAWLIFLRKLHRGPVVKDNYYKVLGISPSASQAEIKSAYFELSKKHHPDRNQGSEESAETFRAIKTAYEVLGSEKTRLQYDKERIFNVIRKPVYTNPADRTNYKDDAERIHFQSRVRKPFMKYTQGRTTFYDFDAWYEGHYGKNSADEFYNFKKPRVFKFHSQPPGTVEEKFNSTPKIKNLLLFLFYGLIIFSGVKLKGPEGKKRRIS